MSTRCTIHVQQPNSSFKIYYHHHDGYLAGVGEYLTMIPKDKRTDVNAILKTLENFYSKGMFGPKKYKIKNYDESVEYSPNVNYLEEVDKDPVDIAWRYTVKNDGTIQAHNVVLNKTWDISTNKLLKKASKEVNNEED